MQALRFNRECCDCDLLAEAELQHEARDLAHIALPGERLVGLIADRSHLSAERRKADRATPTARDLGWFFVGFMTASILWCFVCAGIIALAHRNFSPRTQRLMTGACGGFLLLAGLGVLGDWAGGIL